MKTKTGKLRKRIIAFLLAALLAIYPIANVLPQFAVMAGDELTGSGWWTDTQSSTAQILSDGGTIAFSVQVKTSDALAEGEYAAFCVEATDGTSYFTATSDGDCWGAGTDTDGTSTGVVAGGSYTVTISRDGNNFTADIVDATGASILTNKMYLDGTADFGDTSCYIVSQVGDLSVSVISVEDELVGHATEWWTTTNKSTAISLPDGYTISWDVTVVANNNQTNGTWAAFLVEANDGTSYCSAATNGDIWGNGSDTDDTEGADVSFGNTYAVSIARSGNDFTVTIKGGDADMVMSLVESDSSVDFGDMTCYIMSQVGDLTVELVAITGPQEETVVGDTADWWKITNKSTAISLTDGSTITWDVTLVANNSQADGTYGAFLVEATDGGSYCTATSDGDCWGNGTDIDDSKDTGVTFGNTYRVTISRSGNNFTVTIKGTDADVEMTLTESEDEDTVQFGETTCYIMSQVGNLTVLSYAITEEKEFSTAATSVSVSVNTDEDAVSGTTSTTVSVHDPSIVKGYVEESVTELSADTEIVGVKDDIHTQGIYFIFGSHLAWAYSWDLVNWTTFTNNLNTYYETIFAAEAAWAALGEDGYTVKGNMWAPDVIWNTDMQCWCMYMSINGNSWNSSICLLTSDSLYGSWTYVGTVIYSGFTAAGTTHDYTYTDYADVTGDDSLDSRYWLNNDSSTWNYNYGAHAIDPCVTYDEEGNLWMSYGSWSGGIYMIRLDKETGLRDSTLKYDTETNVSDAYMGYQIAGGNFASGEGSYIEYYNGYYYLFLSYGFYDVNGGYNMRVFRSESINGSYVDESGDSAIFTSSTDNYTYSSGTHTYGMRLMSQYKWSYQTYAQVAQGHNSVYYDEDTDQIYLVYHTKTNDGTAGHYVNVHQLFQNEDGWLVAAPFTYQKETTTNAEVAKTDSESAYSYGEIAGNYEVIVHALSVDYANLAYVDPVYIVLDSDGNITGDLTGTWSVKSDTCYITLVIDNETYHGVLTTGTVEDKTTETLTFTAVGTSSEVAIWGYQYDVVKTETEYLTLPAQTVYGTALDLATTGTYGASISWASSNAAVIATDGTVTVPEDNTDVTLTATISYDGEETATKKFTVTVIGSNSVDEDGNVVVWSSSETYDLTDAAQGTYAFTNYFNSTIGTAGLTLYSGVSIKFTVELTGDYNLFSNILGFTVDGDTSGNILYFTGGSYLGYNGTGGYFDANCDTSTWTAGTDYIGSGQEVEFEIVILPNSYEVYVDGEIAYSMDTVDSGETSGSYAMDSMYSVLTYLSETATEFDLGWGSWWTGGFAGTISNISLTAVAEETVDTSGYVYYANYSNAGGSLSDWTSPNDSGNLVLLNDGDSYGYYVCFQANTATNSRGAYTTALSEAGVSANYTVDVDIKLKNGTSQTSEFTIFTSDASGYTGNEAVSSGYVLKLAATAAGATTYYVNDNMDTTVTIPADTWVHITATVAEDSETVTAVISYDDADDQKITTAVNGSSTLMGLYVRRGHYNGYFCVDNIAVTCQHVWDTGEVTTDPTYKEEGEMLYTCTQCGETKTAAIEVIGENLLGSLVGYYTFDETLENTATSVENAASESAGTESASLHGGAGTTWNSDARGSASYSEDGVIGSAYKFAGNSDVETLTGTGWWNGTETGVDSTLSSDNELTFTVECTADVNNYAAFSVVLYDASGNYFTTGSDGNAWFGTDTTDGVSGILSTVASTIVSGTTYTVTVSRSTDSSGYDVYTVTYYDKTDTTTFATLVGEASVNFDDTVYVHLIAQVGTFTVTYPSEVVSGEGLELDVTTADEFTISMWVNTSQKVNYQPIVLAIEDSSYYVTAGTLYNDFASGGIANYGDTWYWLDKNNNSTSTLKDLVIGTWTYVTLTMTSDGVATLYYNGEALSTQRISGYDSASYTGMPIYLGINWWNESFCGLMDEVTVYDSALTASEVALLYECNGNPQVAVNTVNGYNVTVTLGSVTTRGITSVADLTGGGEVVKGSSVTVTATKRDGYTFLGWYSAETDTADGTVTGYDSSTTALSTEMTYTFTASENVALAAVYQADSAATLTVKTDNLNDATYTVTASGKEVASDTAVDFTGEYDAGTSITLTAATSVEGVTFAYWMSGSSKIVGTEETYTFTIVADTVIYPVYNKSDSESNTAIVEYVTYYGQVLTRETYTSSNSIEDIAVPSTIPSRTGYTFNSWSMSQSDIVEAISEGSSAYIQVTPVYDTKSEAYSITVNVSGATDVAITMYANGDETSTLKSGQSVDAGSTVTVVAPEVLGKTFQYWTDNTDEGAILSYKDSYMVYLSKDIELYAIYVEDGSEDTVTPDSTIVMTNVYSVTESGTSKIAFEATRSVLDGYTVLETGMLVGTDEDATYTVNSNSVTRYISSSTDNDGVFTLYVTDSMSATTVYACGYMIISDGTNLYTYYTGVISGSYSAS